jgi:hypothetical protein
LGLVGLRVVGHVMGSRRFYEKVAVATIVLVALRQIGQDNRVGAMARLQAWPGQIEQCLRPVDLPGVGCTFPVTE